MTNILAIALAAVLTNNVILAQFYGICPFLGVSKKVDTASGMGMAVIFVMGIASAVTWVVNNLVLIPLGLDYMRTVAFIRHGPAELVEYDAVEVHPLLSPPCDGQDVLPLSREEGARRPRQADEGGHQGTE